MNHPIIPTREFVQRRNILKRAITDPVLLMGNTTTPRNFPANQLPFRQDSTFWYFSDCTIPNAAMLLLDGEDILFLPDQDPSDILWHGPQESNEDIAKSLGFDRVLPRSTLTDVLAPLQSKMIHSLAIPCSDTNRWLSQTLNYRFLFGVQNGSDRLIEQVIRMRRILDSHEQEQIRWTSRITGLAHHLTIMMTKTGQREHEAHATFMNQLTKQGLMTAYQTICTVRGEVLHNHHYHNTMNEGDLLLLDGGAESPYGYATDVTRTWPLSGTFTPRQRAAYSAVLKAQEVAINMVRAGVRTRDIHMASCLELANFLVAEGLIMGRPEDAVTSGAHALFFPHGIGHLLGLDVHDMENFGDRAAYTTGRSRSEQFGLSYLRMDLNLEPNMVITIEPGFYIVPAILDHPSFRSQFKHIVNWDVVEKWRGFGGIRIEDNIRCTHQEPENFSKNIRKDIAYIESERQR